MESISHNNFFPDWKKLELRICALTLEVSLLASDIHSYQKFQRKVKEVQYLVVLGMNTQKFISTFSV